MAKGVCFMVGVTAVAVVAAGSLRRSRDSDIGLIEVTPSVIDLGEVPRQQRVTTGFEIHNSTGEEHRVVELRTSCSCLADATTLPAIVPPGQTAFVPLEYRTPAAVGDIKEHILVIIERADGRRTFTSHKLIEISCRTVPGLRSTPSRLDFGSVPSGGDAISASFRIRPDSNTVYDINSIVVTRAEIDVDHPEQIAPGGAELRATFHPSRAQSPGSIRGAIEIFLCGGSGGSISVPFRALVLPGFLAKPDVLLFDGRSHIGSTVPLYVEGAEPFRLVDINVPDSLAVDNYSNAYSLIHQLTIGLLETRSGDHGNIAIMVLAESGRTETVLVRVGRLPAVVEFE